MRMIEIIARAMIIREGKVLLALKKKEGHLFLPGGHLEFGEFIKEALSREMREEMGVETEVLDFVGVLEHLFQDGAGRAHHEINLMFEAEIVGQTPLEGKPRSLEEGLGFIWLDLSGLGEINLLPDALKRLIPQWVRGRKVFFESNSQS